LSGMQVSELPGKVRQIGDAAPKTAALPRPQGSSYPLSVGAGSAPAPALRSGGEKVMSLTLHQKRGLLWGLGILTAVVLMSVAWAQIGAAVGNCLSPF